MKKILLFFFFTLFLFSKPSLAAELSFEPVADGDWFKIKKEFFGELKAIPKDNLPKIAVDSRPGQEPQAYNALKELTSHLTGTDKDNEESLEEFGVWERLRLPQETEVKPEEQFPELEGRSLKVYFDCIGEAQGNVEIKLDKNLGQTQAILSDLTQRLTRIGPLETTEWGENYKIKNSDCLKKATGEEGIRETTKAWGTISFLSPTGFGNFFQSIANVIREWVCQLPGIGQTICQEYQTSFYLLVQPKIIPDPLTATIPELSYTASQKRWPDGSSEKFGGGVFRIFFPPGMESLGEREAKLYRGEPIHGKNLQDYYSLNGWTLYQADNPQAQEGNPTTKMPVDVYGLAGTKAAWDFVQQALTPPNF